MVIPSVAGVLCFFFSKSLCKLARSGYVGVIFLNKCYRRYLKKIFRKAIANECQFLNGVNASIIAYMMRSKTEVVVQEQMNSSCVVAFYFDAATMKIFATENIVKI